MCKKQTSVSHNSTESEIIPFDAGLRMDGLPAQDLFEVLRSPQTNKKPFIRVSGNGNEISKVLRSSKNQKEHPRVSGSGNDPSVDELSQVDHVPSNAQCSQGESKLYIFEDDEAVIR